MTTRSSPARRPPGRATVEISLSLLPAGRRATSRQVTERPAAFRHNGYSAVPRLYGMPPFVHHRDLHRGRFLVQRIRLKTQLSQRLEVRFQDFLRARGLIVGDTKSNG